MKADQTKNKKNLKIDSELINEIAMVAPRDEKEKEN